MIAWLLQVAAMVALLGLAGLGAYVVWIQFTSWMQVNGVDTLAKVAERRVDHLGTQGLAEMFLGANRQHATDNGQPPSEGGETDSFDVPGL